ncbi:MAG: O-antigen ligase family protein [Azonexus sp.]
MASLSLSTPASGLSLNDRFVFLGLLALLVWVPLPLGSNRTWAVGILIVFSQLLLLGAVYVWRRDLPAAMARLAGFKWPLVLLTSFCGLVCLQLIPLPASLLGLISPETLAVQQGVSTLQLSLDPAQTSIYAALSFAYFSCFLVAVLTIRDKARLDRLALVLVGSGLLQALVGIALFSIRAKYPIFFFEVKHNRVLGTYGYHNHMAGYMEMCLSIGIGLMLARLGGGSGGAWRGDWKRKLQAAVEFMLSPKMRLRMILIIIVIALVLTRSRMGNGGFFAAMLIVGLLTISLSRKMAPATVGLIASLVIIDVVVVGSWVGLEKVVDRVQNTSLVQEVAPGARSASGGPIEESLELRSEAARYALDLVADFPLFGTGAGTFYNSYIRYRAPRHFYWDHAHNDYVELAADNGLVGLGILGIFVLLTAAKAIQVLRKRRSSLPRGMAFGGLMALLALMIHSAVDFNLQTPANALTLVVIMAMIWIASELPSAGELSRMPVKKRRSRRSPVSADVGQLGAV